MQQQRQVEQRLKGKHCCFKPGDKVLARNYGNGVKWLPALVITQTGPVSYTAELDDGHLIWKRHADQLFAANPCDSSDVSATTNPSLEMTPTMQDTWTETLPSQVDKSVPDVSQSLPLSSQTPVEETVAVNVPLRFWPEVKKNSKQKST